MAKILCSKSGIEFNCDFFPIHLHEKECHHPIFSVPLKRLFRYFPKWQAGELTETDSYLLFLAYLNSTEFIEFRQSVSYSSNLHQIVQSNMETLFATIGKIITIRHPRFVIPHFVISKETATLQNVSEWIKVWNDCYDSFCSGLKDQELHAKLQRKEAALERLIKNPALRPERYAHILADWAADAAAFPSFQIATASFTGPIDLYWKTIIQKCYKSIDIISIPESDIKELLEHCEENLDLGSIQSYHLFNTLRDGLTTMQDFYGTGPTSFTILNDDSVLNDENVSLLIKDAPIKEPSRFQYPTEFAFLKAKMKWQIAKISTSTSIPTIENL